MLRLERLGHEVVMRWERGDLAEAVRALDRHLQEIAQDRVRHLSLIERAVGLYAGDDIQVDADCTFISESEEGAFVMGWLWKSRRDDEHSNAGPNAAAAHPEEGAKPQ